MLCDTCAIRATALAVCQTSSADSGGEELGPGAGCNLRPPALEDDAPADDREVDWQVHQVGRFQSHRIARQHDQVGQAAERDFARVETCQARRLSREKPEALFDWNPLVK